jgi:hypothetical protein
MGADDSGEDLTCGETNSCQNGTELLIQGDENGWFPNTYMLKVGPDQTLVTRSVDAIQSHAIGDGNGISAEGGTGVYGHGRDIGVAGTGGRNGVFACTEGADLFLAQAAGVFGSAHGTDTSGVIGVTSGGFGVFGFAEDGGFGVVGNATTRPGVLGSSDSSAGVVGSGTEGPGVLGRSTGSTGVEGHGITVGVMGGPLSDESATHGTGCSR